ncbi:MAG: hypothetical protein ACOC7J_04770 [Armatimonadota bacterium]
MWLKNGGFFSALVAVLASGVVLVGTWFTLIHEGDLEAYLQRFSRSVVGVVTLVIVLLAGWLLAIAFDRVEESLVLYRQRSSEDGEAGE